MKRGFTLIELMITVALILVIAGVTRINLGSPRRRADLNSATEQIASLLREAQSDALAQKQQASWGVHFDNVNPAAGFYSLFSTTNNTYTSSSEIGHYTLPSSICYVSSTVAAGSSVNVIFATLSGTPATTTSVSLQLGGCGTVSSTPGGAVLTRTGSGLIFFDDFNRANL